MKAIPHPEEVSGNATKIERGLQGQ
ncbi:uncharacterized protein METZ01_LOCUS251399, partial [marine metagenome]